jgi:hypothetical protein
MDAALRRRTARASFGPDKEAAVDIYTRLQHAMQAKADGKLLETLSIGLGYTCACTSDGGVGVAFTPRPDAAGCSVLDADEDYEGRAASESLALLGAGDPLHRAVGLAVANALNHAEAKDMPEDRDNSVLFDALKIGPGSRVAMVGYFTPLIRRLKERGAELEVVDRGRGLGDEDAFKEKLGSWAQAVIMTSTSIINNTLEELLACVSGRTRVALLGPSTPLEPEAFAGLPVHVLAGTVPLDGEAALRAVRHAKGTPVIQRFSRKPCIML